MKIRLTVHCQKCGEVCNKEKDATGDIWYRCPQRKKESNGHSLFLLLVEKDKETIELILK